MSGSRRSHSAWPRVSDYVVETETDFELFQGQIREVSHAGPLHGDQLSQVNFVLGAYVARGHGVALFLLTRQDADNNFASDISIRKNGTDPDTDDRYLEELAFEIKSTLAPEELEQRARIMARCGVRRVFAIPVTGHPAGIDRVAGPLSEWMPAQERWRTYRSDEVIADECLFEPVPVRALLKRERPLRRLTRALNTPARVAVACASASKRSPRLGRHDSQVTRRARRVLGACPWLLRVSVATADQSGHVDGHVHR